MAQQCITIDVTKLTQAKRLAVFREYFDQRDLCAFSVQNNHKTQYVFYYQNRETTTFE